MTWTPFVIIVTLQQWSDTYYSHQWPNHKFFFCDIQQWPEYRAVSGVFQNIDPPPPFHPASVSSPPHQRRGGTHSLGGEGVGVNISEDARYWIGLLQYNPSTGLTVHLYYCKSAQSPDRKSFCGRYRADDLTGYVAEVTYEGVAQPWQPARRS